MERAKYTITNKTLLQLQNGLNFFRCEGGGGNATGHNIIVPRGDRATRLEI